MRAIGQGGPEVLKEPVSNFMTTTVIAARGIDTINQLMSEMTTRRFRHMPVVETGRLVSCPSAIWSRYRSPQWRWRRPRRGSTPRSLRLFE